jgi:hypothetical protein
VATDEAVLKNVLKKKNPKKSPYKNDKSANHKNIGLWTPENLESLQVCGFCDLRTSYLCLIVVYFFSRKYLVVRES